MEARNIDRNTNSRGNQNRPQSNHSRKGVANSQRQANSMSRANQMASLQNQSQLGAGSAQRGTNRSSVRANNSATQMGITGSNI